MLALSMQQASAAIASTTKLSNHRERILKHLMRARGGDVGCVMRVHLCDNASAQVGEERTGARLTRSNVPAPSLC